jgi:hypothetical protein
MWSLLWVSSSYLVNVLKLVLLVYSIWIAYEVEWYAGNVLAGRQEAIGMNTCRFWCISTKIKENGPCSTPFALPNRTHPLQSIHAVSLILCFHCCILTPFFLSFLYRSPSPISFFFLYIKEKKSLPLSFCFSFYSSTTALVAALCRPFVTYLSNAKRGAIKKPP